MRLIRGLSKAWLYFFIVFWVMISTSTGLAEDRTFEKKHFFIGFTGLFNTFGGGFKGDSYYNPGDELIFVPELKSNYGYGFSFGYRHWNAAGEFAYYKSTHDASFFDVQEEADFSMYCLRVRVYPWKSSKSVHPFFLIAGQGMILKVKDGAITLNEPIKVGDGTFKGLGFDFGGGISFYPHSAFCINTGIFFRWLLFSTVTGVLEESHGIEDFDLQSFSINFTIGIALTLIKI